MSIDFFEKEVTKARERFNQTFGELLVCDLKSRQLAILAICFLGRCANELNKAKNKEGVREKIKKFMRTEKVLNNVFDQIEKQQKERRPYVSSSSDAKRRSNERSNIAG